jgi:putative ABC transport system permease protein
MASLINDLKFLTRMFRSAPVVYLAAVLSLALGAGANSAIFSVVNPLLFKPLPFADPDRLVRVFERDLTPRPGQSQSGHLPPGSGPISAADLYDYAKLNRVFERLSGWSFGDASVQVGSNEAIKVPAAGVLDGFFETLGVQPMVGRSFLPEEEQPGRNREVILGYSLWEKWYAKDPRVIGSKLRYEGNEHVVVGVMPPGFAFPQGTGIWHPAAFPADIAPRNFGFISGIARLKPGTSLAAAQQSLSLLARQFEAQYPDTNKDRGIFLMSLRDALSADLRQSLLVLWGAVAFILLLACSNVTNLMLARSTSRRQEIAVRAAIGASRASLLRQLITESLAVSLAGGALGLVLAWLCLQLMLPMVERGFPKVLAIRIDGAVLGFTFALCLLAGLTVALAPALRFKRGVLTQALRGAGPGTASQREGSRLRYALVVLQVGVAVTLVTGAGLLIKSLHRLLSVDAGFQRQNVLTVELGLTQARYPDAVSTAAFFRDATHRLQQLPGVRAVGSTFFLPLSGGGGSNAFRVEGRQEDEREAVFVQAVTPGFFASMGIPVLRGRGFTEQDDARAPGVAIIDEATARRSWPNQDALGQHVSFVSFFGPAGETSGRREIVGIVGNVRFRGLNLAAEPQLYFPTYQSTWRWQTLTLRTAVEPASLIRPVQREIHAVDPTLALGKIATLESLVLDSAGGPRFGAFLMGGFAAIALLLAAIGISAVVSYTVSLRSREVAIRLALGAPRRDVLRRLVAGGAAPGLLGLALGLAAAAMLSRLIGALLFHVSPLDGATYAGVAGVVVLLLALATFSPARRATTTPPATVLRCE